MSESIWPGGEGKDKGDEASNRGPSFLVGMDGRPVRYPMSDETFEIFRRRLLDAPDSEVVSVARVDGVVKVVTRRSGSPRVTALIGAAVVEYMVGDPIVIEAEPS